METGTASPPKRSRTRIYSVTLVVVTIVVVAVAILLPMILNSSVLPPPTPVAGTNVQVDTYAPGSNWSSQYGDDPTVAVAPNGTFAVAWEGLEELAPPASPGAPPTFETLVFVSYSYDQGQRYSVPEPVGSPGTSSAFQPSLAFAPNGTLFLAYANATDSSNQQILVASATPGHAFGPAVAAQRGENLGRPWLFILSTGTLVLAYDYNSFVEWTESTNGGTSFQPSIIGGIGLLTGATLWNGDWITLVGLGLGALTYTTAFVWSITFNATSESTPEIGAPATVTMPYPYSTQAPNMSRPGPSVASLGGTLYLLISSESESRLLLQTSTTNGSAWAGNSTLWSSPNTAIETPVVEAVPGSSLLILSWESTQGGHWETYAALYNVHTGLLSTPVAVSNAAGFPSAVRNWHGTAMGLAIASSTEFVVVWGDGRGLSGTFGLTQIYACTMLAELS